MKRVLFRPEAVKDLDRLQDRDRDLVEEAIERRQLRLRVGDWRVRFVYEKPDTIRVLHIRNRRDAYRD